MVTGVETMLICINDNIRTGRAAVIVFTFCSILRKLGHFSPRFIYLLHRTSCQVIWGNGTTRTRTLADFWEWPFSAVPWDLGIPFVHPHSTESQGLPFSFSHHKILHTIVQGAMWLSASCQGCLFYYTLRNWEKKTCQAIIWIAWAHSLLTTIPGGFQWHLRSKKLASIWRQGRVKREDAGQFSLPEPHLTPVNSWRTLWEKVRGISTVSPCKCISESFCTETQIPLQPTSSGSTERVRCGSWECMTHQHVLDSWVSTHQNLEMSCISYVK